MSRAEQRLLDKMNCDLLRVDLETLEVRHWHRGHRKFRLKVPSQHPISGRWRFRFDDERNRRTVVYRNRLVWIFLHRQLVPDGYAVDHIDGNRTNDSPDNLRLMELGASHRQGNRKQTDMNFEECMDFFESLVPFL